MKPAAVRIRRMMLRIMSAIGTAEGSKERKLKHTNFLFYSNN